mgnify:CR=1 FL=1
MFSRGVDIRADNLSVRAAFVPTLEDEIQIKGRTGRFGKDGDYRMIINLQDAETPIDGNTYNIEARVTAAQHKMALSASVEEKTASRPRTSWQMVREKVPRVAKGNRQRVAIMVRQNDKGRAGISFMA